ncbi:MAG: hypothetical protein JW814_08205 [Candidatus Krumholzibacteriota bacterium]|nr:hypothetical protein [Candidatus Krumholzibacteriota bacterium]
MISQRRNLKAVWKKLLCSVAPSILLILAVLPLRALAEEKASDQGNFREKRYYYQAFNRRDPFRSLVSGEFEENEYELVDIYNVKLVGILSGGLEKYAMLEDKNGFGYIIKAGDPIRHGSIISVGEQTLVARLTMFGQTNSVTLRLEGKEGKGE